MNNKWTAYVEQDGDDLVIPLPDDMLNELGWKTGDTLIWNINEETGAITLSRKETWLQQMWSKIKSWIS